MLISSKFGIYVSQISRGRHFMPEITDEKMAELVAKFKEFLRERCYKELVKASNENTALVVDYKEMEKFNHEFCAWLTEDPETMFKVAAEAVRQTEMGSLEETESLSTGEEKEPERVPVRFAGLPEIINIRDIRSAQLGKFIATEGIVRRASEIRPEVMETEWECMECGSIIGEETKGSFVMKPFQCSCGGRSFKQHGKKMVDTRWASIEEPFELTEGEKPSQLNIVLTKDLVSIGLRSMSDPGNRIRVCGVLREKPMGKFNSAKLDFYLDVNSVELTEIGWEKVEISREDEDKIKELAADPQIYEKLIDSLAPSIYGYREIKESITMQMFSGVPRIFKDKMKVRGEIHILIIGDPACLIGDERIFLGDGTTTKIQNLGSRHMQSIRVPVRVKGHISDMATTFHVYNNQPIIEMVTESGKSLKGSYNQPVLAVEGMERKWKRLDELKIGDRVAVVPSIQCRKVSLVPTAWIKPDRRFGPRFRGRIPDKWDAKLGALIGYLLGDGYVRENKGEIVAIVNKDEYDLVEILTGYIKDIFGMEPVLEARKVPDHEYHGRTIRSKNELYYIILRSKDLSGNLGFLRSKRVPDPIFLSPDSVVKEFLKWLFQADGTVFCKGRGRRAIQLKQKEIELLRDVQALLLRFGIHSRIYDNNLTIRRGNDILKFAKHIGFASRNKKEKLLELSAEANDVKRVRRQLSEKIVRINRLKGAQTVYDIEVPKSKRFIANGVVVHNSGKSQLLKLVPTMIPRGRYVSGKGVTSAGLTATVTKDEQMGGWVLEAGAMVLSNKGMLAVDEFEKMEETDQVAMHEALEQGSVSIAKASIVATLPAQTSVLAGGNPKFSRFDNYRSIAEQINIPDTLLSRFDLKFVLRDVPNAEKDKLLVDHMLRAREGDESGIEPAIEGTLIKKHIAYAKKNHKPKLTKETGKLLKDFYIKTRKQAEGGNSPIPITLRQFESLIRLAEASAKVQLSDVVRKEDAHRAIRLMEFSLMQLGYDVATGRIDVDKSEGATSFTERKGLRILIDLISAMSAAKKEIPLKELREASRKEGIHEQEIDSLIDKLKREGMLFEPNPGYVQKV